MNTNSKPPNQLFLKRSSRGQRAKQIRIRQDITQVHLAKMLGMRPTHLCALENGRSPFGERMAERIAHVLHVHPSAIMYGQEEQNITNDSSPMSVILNP